MKQPLDLGADFVEGGPKVLEDVGGDALPLDEEPEQQVLGAHVVVPHPSRLLEGDLDDLLHAGRWDDLLDDDALVPAEH